MTPLIEATFKRDLHTHCQHLKLKGLRPKTIEAYTRAIERIGAYFGYQLSDLTEAQLLDYFAKLLDSHSWSTVKLDLYGLKFFYQHVLKKPWMKVDLIKPPKATRLRDIVTPQEAGLIFQTTHKLSYRVFFFTLYSLGLRLGEGLNLQVGDIDAHRRRVHIRNAKGNKDRFVPLPDLTYDLLRRFWAVHRNPTLLFPNRKSGLKGSQAATTPLDRGGVQGVMKTVVKACGIKKTSHHTVYGIATQPI